MAARIIRPAELRKLLREMLQKEKSLSGLAKRCGCSRSNLYEALSGRRQIPRAAARVLGYARVTAYTKIEFAYPPLDNRNSYGNN